MFSDKSPALPASSETSDASAVSEVSVVSFIGAFSLIVGMFLNKSVFFNFEISVADSSVLSMFKRVC